MKRHLFESLKIQLKRYEGCSLNPYRCPTGHLTIGYGRNLEAKGVSISEAERMLENDIRDAEYHLVTNLPSIYHKVNDVRKIVLIDMTFNMGIGNLLKFKKMINALIINDFQKASKEMLDSKWANQVGDRAVELSKMMRKG